MRTLVLLLLLTMFASAANIGMIKMNYNSGVYAEAATQACRDTLVMKVDSLVKRYPKLDIIVTPEYSLFPVNARRGIPGEIDSVFKTAVTLQENGSGYTFNADKSSPTMMAAIQHVQQIAKDNSLYFFLGTIPEKVFPDLTKYPAMKDSVVCNTMLIINPNGDIEDIDRKASGTDWLTPNPEYYQGKTDTSDIAYFRDGVKFTNTTTKARELTTGDGETIRYFPLICAERGDTLMMSYVRDEKVDLIIEPQFEGDFRIHEAMVAIQNGELESLEQTGWGWYMDDLIIDQYSSTYAVAHDSAFYLMNNSTYGGFGGLVNFQKKRLVAADTSSEHYYYAEAVIGTKVTVVEDSEAPTVTLKTPTSENSFEPGTTVLISWEATDNIAVTSLKVEFCTDGINWTEIPGISGTSHSWTAPSFESDSYQIRVTASDAIGNSSSATSEPFSVKTSTIEDNEAPVVTIDLPLAGSSFEPGTEVVIRWSATDNFAVTSQKVEFSTDGMNWTEIAGINGNSHSWIAPSLESDNYRIRITASDAAGNSSWKISELFTISKTSVVADTANPSANLLEWGYWSAEVDQYGSSYDTGATLFDGEKVSVRFSITESDSTPEGSEDAQWAWGSLGASFPEGETHNLSEVKWIRITYSSDSKFRLSLPQQELLAEGETFGVILPAASDTTVLLNLMDFKKPDWSTNKTELNLTAISGLTFDAQVAYEGGNCFFSVSEVIIYNYQGEEVSIHRVSELNAITPSLISTAGKLNLVLPAHQEVTMSLFTPQGRMVVSHRFRGNAGTNAVAVPHLSAGIYLVQLMTETASITQRVVIY